MRTRAPRQVAAAYARAVEATGPAPATDTVAASSVLGIPEADRARAPLVTARAEVATCAISGAVGSFANIDPQVEEHVAAKMGLKPEPVSTQVIPRDRHETAAAEVSGP